MNEPDSEPGTYEYDGQSQLGFGSLDTLRLPDETWRLRDSEVTAWRDTPTSIGEYSPSHAHRYALAKTVLDIAVCLMILPLAVLLMAVIAVAILVDSGRPIFFVQERVGRGRRIFRMYKFRTLPCDYDRQVSREYMQAFVRGEPVGGEGHHKPKIYKPFDKSQITRVGRILRKTSLDELPQIFNVLRREMSLVGPRPNVAYEVEAYQGWHFERLEALPGITGLAQVRGRSSICFDDIVHNDIDYIRNQSLKLDLQILWWTVLETLGGRGAH